MNTIRSVGYGWGFLIVAGGGAYYLAKKNINEDRAARSEADRQRREAQRRSEYLYTSRQSAPLAASDEAVNPSSDANQDPAATRHAPETAAQKTVEKSKYEASEPWRSKKGDRFS